MLLTRLIPTVGDYYSILRQCPEKKGSSFEYMPNAMYKYRDVICDLAQLNTQAPPPRMWLESVFSTILDLQSHPYIE